MVAADADELLDIAEPPAETAPHLLVVDDDSRLRSVLRRYLQRNGFRITEAADAAGARTQLALFEFDLLMLDVMMPGESGLSLLSELRKSSRVPVLMLTAMTEPGDRVAGLERGADDYPREAVRAARAGAAAAQHPVARRPAAAGARHARAAARRLPARPLAGRAYAETATWSGSRRGRPRC